MSDIKELVDQLNARVQKLEDNPGGTPALFAARFKQQLAAASSIPAEFKNAVQTEITSWKAQQEAQHYDHENIAAKTETVGGKAEAVGGKVEATGLQVGIAGGQFEYSLFKHEKAVFDLNKILEDREQRNRDRVIDGRFADLVRTDRNIRAAISAVQERITTSAREVRRSANAGDQRVREQVAVVRAGLRTANRVAHSAEQSGRNALQQIRDLRRHVLVKTREAEGDLKATLRKVRTLDREVKDGMQQVRELEGSARGAGRSIQGLRNDLNSLEQTLRR
ncbi:hypothetical protein [Streptomyces pseudovenezuelae]|uniref:Uncharacterized protein n=1 Tax=Streptomyces pseudovenezuelae TaxID=67350 RepID=A0ABT6LKI0_9ACTN|nr:hypothetical protein [Streptomyces pseudovenezuelae]MDH6216763.1 hypothetical protein [Streptomyces pseudovenezuelae]